MIKNARHKRIRSIVLLRRACVLTRIYIFVLIRLISIIQQLQVAFKNKKKKNKSKKLKKKTVDAERPYYCTIYSKRNMSIRQKRELRIK